MTQSAILTTPEQINHFRNLTLLSMLKLEIKGLKVSKGKTAYSIIKTEFKLRGNKTAVYNQLAQALGKPML
jgi:hypothetical protein